MFELDFWWNPFLVREVYLKFCESFKSSEHLFLLNYVPSILHVLVLSVPIEPWQLLCLAYLNCPHVSSMVTGYLSAILYSNKNVLMGGLGQDSNHKNQSCYNINLNFEKNTLVFICSLHANQITQKKRSLNLWYIY